MSRTLFIRKTRKALYKGHCVYCFLPLLLTDATADHIIPVSNGGTTEADNLIICCNVCNSDKGSSSAEEWNKIAKFSWYKRIFKGLCRLGRIKPWGPDGQRSNDAIFLKETMTHHLNRSVGERTIVSEGIEY